MNEEVTQGLNALLPALRTLQRALEQVQAAGTTKGSGRAALRHYRLLHEQIVRLLPEDRHIVDGLAADVDETADDDALVAQVHLLAQQLYVYVRSISRQVSDEKPGPTRQPGHRPHMTESEWQTGQAWKDIASDYRRLGRELKEQIMQQTRDSIRTAMAGIQVDIQHAWDDWDRARPVPPTPPTPPMRTPGVPIPPVPPTPPQPPVPPQGKMRIHIDLNDDEWSGDFEDSPDPSDQPPTPI